MISQPLQNFKTQFPRKDELGSYDNIALNQQYTVLKLNYETFQNSTLSFFCITFREN